MRSSLRFTLVAAALALSASARGLTAQEQGAQDQGPERIMLTGASLGGVDFAHKAHQDATDCSSCHHDSRPEKPLESEQQACTACHVKTPVAPMTTNIRDAFHDARGKAGTCVDCHVTEAAAGKTVPVKCTECHKKENVAPGS
jgi:hypothetical protein